MGVVVDGVEVEAAGVAAGVEAEDEEEGVVVVEEVFLDRLVAVEEVEAVCPGHRVVEGHVLLGVAPRAPRAAYRAA
jgi:hypothetical protein